MKGHAWNEIFPNAQRALFERVALMIQALPELPFLRCHELTRAVYDWTLKHDLSRQGTIHDEVIDGTFAGCEHSWILLRDPHRQNSILDVYSVARVPMVQLIDVTTPTLLPGLYEPGEKRTDINEAHIDVILRWWSLHWSLR